MSISSKIALVMSADGDSFERVHNSLEKLTDDFAIGFAQWKDKNCFNQGDVFYIRNYKDEAEAFTLKELLEIYKLVTGL